VADHAAPVGWWERWQAAEPIRLYLWTVATAVLAASVTAGVITENLYVALTGVASAVLTFGGAAAARRRAYAPLTVDQLLDRADREALEQARNAYAAGVRDGTGARTPDTVAAELVTSGRARLEDGTVLMAAARGCPYMDEHGKRCQLPEHPRKVEHQLEA
jgi:hypothetical protein